MIKVMVVDDERNARESLSRLIAQDKDFEIGAEASDGDEAIQKLDKESFDAVFLDVDMPTMSGLEVAAHIAEKESGPIVVFATAYDQYAVNAFDAHAVDYILKPYQPDRIKQALGKIKKAVGSRQSSRENLVALEQYLVQNGKVKLLIGYKFKSKVRKIILPQEVFYFEAKAGEVSAHVEGTEYLIRSNLEDVLAILNATQFAQTHKAYIVNLEKIDTIESLFHGDYQIHLKSNPVMKIPLSRKFVPEIKQLIGGW